MEIREIFRPAGLPQHTYVQQDRGNLERTIKSSIMSKGELCIVTGPSKVGKSTLYNKVLNDLRRTKIEIRCHSQLTFEEFWRQALEKVHYSRISEISNDSTLSANLEYKLGWKVLADLLGEAKIGISGEKSESQVREFITSQPNPDHLIPVLQSTNAILVVEDFHFLNEETRINIFQQLKILVDNSISLIIVETTNQVQKLIRGNDNLIGRTSQAKIKLWQEIDLVKIVELGFAYLGLEIESEHKHLIAKESAGLPLITQQVCLKLFHQKEMYYKNEISQPFKITKSDIAKSANLVATSSYSNYEAPYSLLTKKTDGDTISNMFPYLVFIFSQNPIKSTLIKKEIIERLQEYEIAFEINPSTIDIALETLNEFQNQRDFEVLNWSTNFKTLSVSQPAFLFYLRWILPMSNNISNDELIDNISFIDDDLFKDILDQFEL